ncbi:MAG: hypothetical protein ACTSRE_04995 [Promethearchaeota archaeon]
MALEPETWQFELFKFVLTLASSGMILLLSWGVGQSLSAKWSIRQKRRELQLSAANTFDRLYGEFYKIWKLWRFYKKEGMEGEKDVSQWDLLAMTCEAEAGMEGILIKIASEFTLTDQDIITLGRFRQAFQTLRETIRENKPLTWNHPYHPQYMAFKKMGAYIAAMLSEFSSGKDPSREEAMYNLQRITSTKFKDWWQDQADKPIEEFEFELKGLEEKHE